MTTAETFRLAVLKAAEEAIQAGLPPRRINEILGYLAATDIKKILPNAKITGTEK